ncbi:MAG: TonB-dependent receptor [Tannerellaceae bacterium]|nr:TonB-dependent receptor [Tannerellaceae bacterium]
MLSVDAQQADSTEVNIRLEDVIVRGEPYRKVVTRASALPMEVAGERFLQQHFTGNLTQTLEHLPGIHSMDIGSGFAKPVIRGMGFNRISVTENGIKQEGQQWGADHGLEIDAFRAERITVRKGPASLLYGSDAMGGAIEIISLPAPDVNCLLGEAVLLGKSVNATLGGSLMLGVKHNAWYAKMRFSEQHFGDYRVPADTIVYLTQRLPVARRLKNTAGLERDVSLYAEYRQGAYGAVYAVSNAYQKVGFFAGAHGIPDASRLDDDGDWRNIDLPYSRVNHLKVSSRQQYTIDGGQLTWDAGFQRNDRDEWSLFHTHYAGQLPPEKDPDRELFFSLDTYASSLKLRLLRSTWEHTVGWDVQYQQNRIGGYAFLLPAYRRLTTGLFWIASWHLRPGLTLSGGLRYDRGRIDCEAYLDRSYDVDRRMDDVSGSAGVVWTPGEAHQLKANIGRSFRLPSANELASNGLHHGAFRHEQGTPSLSSEQGWQWDVAYAYEARGLSLEVSPFVAWFGNYIYLKPTGEWSSLPHAGQVYRYTGAEAVFAGAEVSLSVDLLRCLTYDMTAEYVHTYNVDEQIPLSFSPPASMRHTLSWTLRGLEAWVECQSIAAQCRTARNEDPTPGANLLHAGANFSVAFCGTRAQLALSIRNLLDTAFYNHLSFYRKIEIPEPGRNFQLVIKVPFKNN